MPATVVPFGHRGLGISYGRRCTVVKDRRNEIGKGLPRSVLADLGIDPKDF